ncbi:RnfH family protein [Marinicella rhabdoformis]|uniref:RnfH family protein n=1 Tax=Marinicella rhabdoformis TaxID=2580566 RepID=UPI0012AED63E|nr:RnfH family protein [Marinicella rhabdoformis]
MLDIEVIYAKENEQIIFKVSVDNDATIEQAILASNILNKYPEIDMLTVDVGVFSQRKKMSDGLNNGDRIEIYRPLIADPKQKRRAKAEVQKENKQFL